MEKFKDSWVEKKRNSKIALVVTLILIGLVGVLLIILSTYENNFLAALFQNIINANKVLFWLGVGIAVFGFLDAILLNVPTKKEKNKRKEEKVFEKVTPKNIDDKTIVCPYCGRENKDGMVQCKYCNASLKK